MVIGGFDITDQYIRARQHEPTEFDSKSFKTIRLTSGIKAIVGKKQGETSTTVQSVIFDKKKFTPEKAKSWLDSHGTKFSDAMNLEQQKVALFSEDPLTQHMDCHLPPLSPKQIEKLLELAGPADDMPEDTEEYNVDLLVPQETQKFSEINKYVRLV